MKQDFKKAYSFLLHTSILWIASSELINWMDIAESNQSYKLGLSILWGIYALLLIVLGIWKKQKHLRIGAIGLFGATLIKLFFYDISHMDTISKTISKTDSNPPSDFGNILKYIKGKFPAFILFLHICVSKYVFICESEIVVLSNNSTQIVYIDNDVNENVFWIYFSFISIICFVWELLYHLMNILQKMS